MSKPTETSIKELQDMWENRKVFPTMDEPIFISCSNNPELIQHFVFSEDGFLDACLVIVADEMGIGFEQHSTTLKFQIVGSMNRKAAYGLLNISKNISFDKPRFDFFKQGENLDRIKVTFGDY